MLSDSDRATLAALELPTDPKAIVGTLVRVTLQKSAKDEALHDDIDRQLPGTQLWARIEMIRNLPSGPLQLYLASGRRSHIISFYGGYPQLDMEAGDGRMYGFHCDVDVIH